MEARSSAAASPQGPELSVVAPAHNEQEYLAGAVVRLVDGLRARGVAFEIVVCENGSTDRTRDVAAGLAAELPEVRYLSLPTADYGQALRAGFLAAAGRLVANVDVDLVDLDFVQRALELERDDGADVVIGSKRGPGSDDTRRWSRRVVTGVFSVLLRRGFGLRATDTHGIKLLRRSAMVDLVTCCRSGSDIFDTELVLRAERAGRRLVEVPIRVAEQRPPRTTVVGRIPRTLLGLARLRLRLWAEGAAGRAGSPGPR